MIRRPRKLIRVLKGVQNRLHYWVHGQQTLIYKGFTAHPPEVIFHFQYQEKNYTTTIVLDQNLTKDLSNCDATLLDTIWAHVGMAFVPYLFRLDNFSVIRVDTLPLTKDGIAFFQMCFLKSIAEWRFLQGLDVSRPINIVTASNLALGKPKNIGSRNEALLLNGGGKDTVVAAEIVKKLELPFRWFTVDPNATRRKIIQISGNGHTSEMTVELASAIDTDGYYKWAPDPSAMVYAFLSLLPAYVYKTRYIIVGNEYSANFGNTVSNGIEVNHQYSKSYEFEVEFDRYVKKCLFEDITHLSLLRPLYEIRIAQIFAHFSPYFSSFVSCNIGLKNGIWCKRCPKCAFIFLALYPFLTPEELKKIFGENLFNSQVIRSHIVDLTSAKIKPWECVGTHEESRLALSLTLLREPTMDFDRWPKRKDLEKCCREIDIEQAEAEYLHSFKSENLLPKDITHSVQQIVDSFSVR